MARGEAWKASDGAMVGVGRVRQETLQELEGESPASSRITALLFYEAGNSREGRPISTSCHFYLFSFGFDLPMGESFQKDGWVDPQELNKWKPKCHSANQF